MALHKAFPASPHALLEPDIRWFPADEALRETGMEKLMPPLVAHLRRKVKGGFPSRSLGTSETPLISICCRNSETFLLR